MQRSIDEATAEIERLQADIEDARLARAQLLQDYGALQAEVKRWQVRWKELDDENRKVWAENDRLKGEIKTYQAQFEHQGATCTQLAVERDEARADVGRLRHEVARLVEICDARLEEVRQLRAGRGLRRTFWAWWDARSTWRK